MDIDVSKIDQLKPNEISLFNELKKDDWKELERDVYVARLSSIVEPTLVDSEFQDVFSLNDVVINHPRLGSSIAKLWIPAQDSVLLWRKEGSQPIKYLMDVWTSINDHSYSVINSAEMQPVYAAYVVNLTTGVERATTLWDDPNATAVLDVSARIIRTFLESRVDGERIIKGLKALDVDNHIPLQMIKIQQNYLGGYLLSDGNEKITASSFVEYVDRCLATV